MKIGELSQRTRTPTKTIRYYEEIGVLPVPERAPNGYRDYLEAAVARLAFVREAQATGLSLTEIASILDLRSQGEATCHHVIDLLERHLNAIDRHLKSLRATPANLVARACRVVNQTPADYRNPNRCQTIEG